MCMRVFVCVSRREIDRVANRWTGRLVVCLSTFKTHQTSPFCDYTVYLQVWKKKKERKRNGREWASCYLRACAAWACGGSHMFLAVLSKPVCLPGGCHGNSQTAADFAPASSGGLWEQRGGLRARNLSESLKKKSFGEKPPNFLFFWCLRLLILQEFGVFEDFSKPVLIQVLTRTFVIYFFPSFCASHKVLKHL